MITVREPMGKYVALARMKPGAELQPPVSEEIDRVVEALKVRLQEEPIAHIAGDMSRSLFELRLEMINWMAGQEEALQPYLKAFTEKINAKLQLTMYSRLGDGVARVLLAYADIIGSSTEKLQLAFQSLEHNPAQPHPAYKTFELLALHPAPKIRCLKKWLDASLKVDLGILLSELVLSDQLSLSEGRIEEELLPFLKSSIREFGAYSIFTGYWDAANAQDEELLNEMKIFAATLELEHGGGVMTNAQTLENLLNA